MKKSIIFSAILIIVVGGGSFYGGMKYGESKTPQGLSEAERQQRLQQIGGGFGGNRTGNQSGAGFVNGEIISKDNQSITVKLRDGSSKIVFYSATSEISKFASGSSGDLEVGKTVTINGTANSDGSYTAQTIQIRQLPGPNIKE